MWGEGGEGRGEFECMGCICCCVRRKGRAKAGRGMDGRLTAWSFSRHRQQQPRPQQQQMWHGGRSMHAQGAATVSNWTRKVQCARHGRKKIIGDASVPEKWGTQACRLHGCWHAVKSRATHRKEFVARALPALQGACPARGCSGLLTLLPLVHHPQLLPAAAYTACKARAVAAEAGAGSREGGGAVEHGLHVLMFGCGPAWWAWAATCVACVR